MPCANDHQVAVTVGCGYHDLASRFAMAYHLVDWTALSLGIGNPCVEVRDRAGLSGRPDVQDRH